MSLSFVSIEGGGPANTARAIARLGQEVEFIDGFSGPPLRSEIDAAIERSDNAVH